MNITWNYRPGACLDCHDHGGLLWRYQFTPEMPKAFFHPVHTPSGRLVTCSQPWDHHWHYGLWFSWKYLNGHNVWELPEAGPRQEAGGRAFLVGKEEVNLYGGRGSVTLRLRYVSGTGSVLATEVRGVAFGGVREDGSYALDWTIAISASREAPLTLDVTPINDKTPWGGYGGMSYRAERSMAVSSWKSHDSEGRQHAAIEHQRARWVDYAAPADGGVPAVAGVAILDHPGNPRHPSHWRYIASPGFGYINPSLAMREPFTVAAGGTLTLRYRVLVHDGERGRAVLDHEFEKWSQESSSAVY
ncbi:MAG: PmoA family protein [Planctomycetes bacterium]|nr:PmoA family protein [Planctomycetota bacterium]